MHCSLRILVIQLRKCRLSIKKFIGYAVSDSFDSEPKHWYPDSEPFECSCKRGFTDKCSQNPDISKKKGGGRSDLCQDFLADLTQSSQLWQCSSHEKVSSQKSHKTRTATHRKSYSTDIWQGPGILSLFMTVLIRRNNKKHKISPKCVNAQTPGLDSVLDKTVKNWRWFESHCVLWEPTLNRDLNSESHSVALGSCW